MKSETSFFFFRGFNLFFFFFRKFELCEITDHVSLNRRVSFYFTSVPYKHTGIVPSKCAVNNPT